MATQQRASVCIALVSPDSTANFVMADLALGLPTLAFIVFLASGLSSSLRKLRRSQSHVMSVYYAFLWIISVLQLLRFAVQVGEGASHATLWNLSWLLTRFGLELLEVSVVVFLLQGYVVSGQEALMRTLWGSGAFAAFDTFIKALYIFAFHVPLYLYGGGAGGSGAGDLRWSKWSFWTLHATFFCAVYAGILVVPRTQWKEMLPAKPVFFRYVAVLCGINAGAAVGACLLGLHVQLGYCLYGLAELLYNALLPPLLYATFLRDFFAAEEVDDELFLMEMRDGGFLGDGSEEF